MSETSELADLQDQLVAQARTLDARLTALGASDGLRSFLLGPDASLVRIADLLSAEQLVQTQRELVLRLSLFDLSSDAITPKDPGRPPRPM
ncbi:MAG: hypothetical protein ABSF61_04525 [Anaerolineales bacterium]|jgi:hypothetical protein